MKNVWYFYRIILCLFTNLKSGAEGIHVTVISYGHGGSVGPRASVNYTRIGFEVVQRKLGAKVNISRHLVEFSFQTLTKPSMKDCFDADANVDLVAGFYHSQTWNESHAMILMTPGRPLFNFSLIEKHIGVIFWIITAHAGVCL